MQILKSEIMNKTLAKKVIFYNIDLIFMIIGLVITPFLPPNELWMTTIFLGIASFFSVIEDRYLYESGVKNGYLYNVIEKKNRIENDQKLTKIDILSISLFFISLLLSITVIILPLDELLTNIIYILLIISISVILLANMFLRYKISLKW